MKRGHGMRAAPAAIDPHSLTKITQRPMNTVLPPWRSKNRSMASTRLSLACTSLTKRSMSGRPPMRPST
jgi:hypothetical protein